MKPLSLLVLVTLYVLIFVAFRWDRARRFAPGRVHLDAWSCGVSP